jgi:hypothetical protein
MGVLSGIKTTLVSFRIVTWEPVGAQSRPVPAVAGQDGMQSVRADAFMVSGGSLRVEPASGEAQTVSDDRVGTRAPRRVHGIRRASSSPECLVAKS